MDEAVAWNLDEHVRSQFSSWIMIDVCIIGLQWLSLPAIQMATWG